MYYCINVSSQVKTTGVMQFSTSVENFKENVILFKDLSIQ